MNVTALIAATTDKTAPSVSPVLTHEISFHILLFHCTFKEFEIFSCVILLYITPEMFQRYGGASVFHLVSK